MYSDSSNKQSNNIDRNKKYEECSNCLYDFEQYIFEIKHRLSTSLFSDNPYAVLDRIINSEPFLKVAKSMTQLKSMYTLSSKFVLSTVLKIIGSFLFLMVIISLLSLSKYTQMLTVPVFFVSVIAVSFAFVRSIKDQEKGRRFSDLQAEYYNLITLSPAFVLDSNSSIQKIRNNIAVAYDDYLCDNVSDNRRNEKRIFTDLLGDYRMLAESFLNVQKSTQHDLGQCLIITTAEPYGLDMERSSLIADVTSSHKVKTKDSRGNTTALEVYDFSGTIYSSPIKETELIQFGERLVITGSGDMFSSKVSSAKRIFEAPEKFFSTDSEELAKNLNIWFETSGTDGLEIQMRLERLFSPQLEEMLLYMYERYGQFIMTVASDKVTIITASLPERNDGGDLSKDLLSRMTKGLSKSFKETSGSKYLLSGIGGKESHLDDYSEFRYWNIFSILEAEYLIFAIPIFLNSLWGNKVETGDYSREEIYTIQEMQRTFEDTSKDFFSTHEYMLNHYKTGKEFKEFVLNTFGDISENLRNDRGM